MEQLGAEQRVAVLGGGIAGLSAAWKLAEGGATWISTKRRRLWAAWQPVGNATATSGISGPIASTPITQRFWRPCGDLIGDDLLTRYRKTRVYFMNHFYDYPLNASNLLVYLPKSLAVLSMLDFISVKIRQTIRPADGRFVRVAGLSTASAGDSTTSTLAPTPPKSGAATPPTLGQLGSPARRRSGPVGSAPADVQTAPGR